MGLRKKRKKEIISAAMNIFSKNGFENSKIEDIAIEAGIGKGTIYGYFASKKNLFEEMISYNMDEYKEELLKIVVEEKNFAEKLEILFQYHTRFIDRNVDIFQIISINKILSESMKNKFMEEQKNFLELIKDMIKKAIDSDEINKNIDLEVAALCIIGSINQLSNKRIFIDKISVDKIDFTSLINIIMKGLEK